MIQEYFSGQKLYGDDFNLEQIQQWFEDEAEAYANLPKKDRSEYVYRHHANNNRHAFRFLKGTYDNVLSFGGAYGEELLPIVSRIKSISIVEPSEELRSADLAGIPIHYEKPSIEGMSFDENTFDLITCFGVLHHVPNVSDSIRDFYRVAKQGGTVLLREPIVSMGDWRKPRVRLTKRERGIPLNIFREIIRECGFSIERETLCGFPPVRKLGYITGKSAYNSQVLVRLDAALANIFRWNYSYHKESTLGKFRPTIVYYVLKK